MLHLRVSDLIDSIQTLDCTTIQTTALIDDVFEDEQGVVYLPLKRTASIGVINSICMECIIGLSETEPGIFRCEHIKLDPAKTQIQLKFEGLQFVFGGELHCPDLLCSKPDFIELILETKLAEIDIKEVNKIIDVYCIDHMK